MSLSLLFSFFVTMLLSIILIPIVKNIGEKFDIIAEKNERTIHSKRIVRIGGLAIYISFLIGSTIFLKTDRQINAIMLGGFLVFCVGLLDDMYNLSPKTKLFVEVIASLIIIFYGGISLKQFNIPFIPITTFKYIGYVIALFWIIGITNAINFIDGLDGLCTGLCVIVLTTIALISGINGRVDIATLSILLIGSTIGCWFYNFYPASIFLGDCGALFLGFMISVISLLGFGYKSSTFFTLGAPIVVLAVPIMDTLSAILRRKLSHKGMAEADRGHMHHKLMFDMKLGHRNSVIILYIATILFSLVSYIYPIDNTKGVIAFVILLFLFEIFVEYSELISRRYKPVLTVVNLFIGSEKLPITSRKQKRLQSLQLNENLNKDLKYINQEELKEFKAMKKNKKNKMQLIIIGVLTSLVVGAIIGIYFINRKNNTPDNNVVSGVVELDYIKAKEETELMTEVFSKLIEATNNGNIEDEIILAATYFSLDFYTWSNKTNRNQIGGLTFVIPEEKNSFAEYTLSIFYLNFDEHLLTYGQEGLPEVESYELLDFKESEFVYEITGNSNTYDVFLKLNYKYKPEGMPTESLRTEVVITMMEIEDKFYVVGVNYHEVELND